MQFFTALANLLWDLQSEEHIVIVGQWATKIFQDGKMMTFESPYATMSSNEYWIESHDEGFEIVIEKCREFTARMAIRNPTKIMIVNKEGEARRIIWLD